MAKKRNVKYNYDDKNLPEVNLAMALYAIANELSELNRIGSAGDEPVHPGPVEGLSIKINDGLGRIAEAVERLGDE